MKCCLSVLFTFAGFILCCLPASGQHSLDDRLQMAAYGGNCQNEQLLEREQFSNPWACLASRRCTMRP